jgi:hypothetical protein
MPASQSQIGRSSSRIDILLFAMVIASAVSLVVVSPRKAKQETLRALRDYDDMLPVHAYGADEESKKTD